jgi:IPT/TIG domain-containing protein
MSGGTQVQITGSNFAAGAEVAIGGAPATDVVVNSPSAITARTPPRSSTGAADVTVTLAGKTGTLPGGFSYQIDPAPPVIQSITAQGSRPNEPAGFADVGEEITVTAYVSDPDTPIDQLQFQWTADVGTFNGSGPTVIWKAPADARTPLPVTISVTATDNVGSVSSSIVVNLHNSIKEVGDLAREFLLDFSDSTKPPDYVMRNFSTSPRCSTSRSSEFADVVKNRTDYKIEKSTIGDAKVTVQFNSFPCSYRPINGDACAVVPASWDSLCLVTNPECNAGEHTHADGLDYVTEVYEDTRWRLCGSDYGPKNGIRFMR